MFFQDTPPDTSTYMIAGYAVFFIVMAIYLISLFVRARNLNQDLTTLENLQQESKVTESKLASSKPAAGKAVAAKKKAPGRTKKKKTLSKK